MPSDFPVSVVLVELTMRKLEESCILRNIYYDLIFWKRNVENCLLITRSSQVDTFLTFINNINVDSHFTCENEDNNSMGLLDTRIIKTTEDTLHIFVIGSLPRKTAT